jgi:AAA ATPase domain
MEHTFTLPWLPVAFAIGAIVGIARWWGHRQEGRAIGHWALMIVCALVGLVITADPQGTVGWLDSFASQGAMATLAGASDQDPAAPASSYADATAGMWQQMVQTPLCAVEFGDTRWCMSAIDKQTAAWRQDLQAHFSLRDVIMTRCCPWGLSVGGLLDRDREVGAARDALSRAARGEGAALVIAGAAGMGKSVLLEHLRQESADAGFRVLRVRGELLEREFPWGAVRRLFRPLGHDHRGAAGLAEIARRGAVEDPGSLFAALHGLHWLAVGLAAQQPLALFIDDAHWLDVLSLRWLAYVAARVADDPILLVVAARPGPIEAAEGAWPALLAGARVLELSGVGRGRLRRH